MLTLRIHSLTHVLVSSITRIGNHKLRVLVVMNQQQRLVRIYTLPVAHLRTALNHYEIGHQKLTILTIQLVYAHQYVAIILK